MTEEQLKYPIGKFTAPAEYTKEAITSFINDIKELPANLRKVAATLTEEQLETPYRPDGWTLRQVIHHLADSHMRSPGSSCGCENNDRGNDPFYRR